MRNSPSVRSRSGSRGAPSLVQGTVAAVLLLSALSLSACTERTVLTMRHGINKIDKVVKIDKVATHHIKETEAKNAVKVWFLKEKGGTLHLVPVTRKVAGGDTVRECISELLYGPTRQEAKSGLASEIPRGTVLIGVTQHDGEVVLNLSRRFAVGGDDSFSTRLAQLRRTVAGAAGARKVFLDVEGKRLTEAGGEGLEVRQPINM
jgi:spore germination protein GerM